MSLHESRRSPARRIDDLQLLQGLLTQRLYVPEHDRRLLHALLAETPRQLRTTPRSPRRGARRLRATGAALALSGALALTLGSPLLTAVAASPQPATWVAVADHAADNLAAPADDVLLRALLNSESSPIQTVELQAVATTDQVSDVLLRALLNSESLPIQAVATADQAASPTSEEHCAMRNLFAGLRRQLHRDDGQDLIEYALLVGPVSLVCIVALTAAGSQVNVIFDNVKNRLTTATANT